MQSLPDCLRISIPNRLPPSGNHPPSFLVGTSPFLSSRSRWSPQRRHILQTTCAKRVGDGKQRRPKSNAKSAEEQKNGVKSPPPPRVDVNSLLDVRTQIRLVKAFKEKEASAYRRAKPPVPQTYRKETKAPEEYRQERAKAEAEAAELSKLESKNFALSKLYRTSGMEFPPILLVDGYNVLHKWDRTAVFMADGQIEIARDKLIEALGVYSHTNGMRVVVAFDAMNGPAAGIEEHILSTGVTVAYTGNCEADSFIEAQVDYWLQRRHRFVAVATSDVAQKAVVDSKIGPNKGQLVHVMPSSGLCKDIEATEKRLEQQLREIELKNSFARGILGSAVKSKNENAFKTMQNMRLTMPTAPTLAKEKLKAKWSSNSAVNSTANGKELQKEMAKPSPPLPLLASTAEASTENTTETE